MTVLELLEPAYQVKSSLQFDRILIAQGQWWRLLSAHFVHSNLAHLLMNIAGLLLTFWLFAKTVATLHWLGAIAISAAGIGSLLFYCDEIDVYMGFSAVIHALLVYAALHAALIKQERWSLLVLLLIAAKILQEQIYGASNFTSQLIASDVALSSHLFGAIVGLCLGLICWLMGFASKTQFKAFN